MIPQWNNFLKKGGGDFVGINLGSYYLKGLVVKEGKVVDYFIKKKEDLSIAIKKLWIEKKISAKKVKISVKNPSCLVRYFSFPKMDRKKMSQALLYEMDKFIPFPSDEVYFDFFVLGESAPTEALVLLAAAKKDFINQILESFEKNDLRISEISLDSICLINIFLSQYKETDETNTCILDIGYDFSTMTILNKNIPFLTRDVKFNAKDLLQVMSRLKDLSFSDIEKRLASSKGNKEFLELAQDAVSGLCEEMKSSFDYFEVNTEKRIDKVCLSGGLASVRGLTSIFSEALDAEVSVLDAFHQERGNLDKIFFDKKFDNLKNHFSVAFGLIL